MSTITIPTLDTLTQAVLGYFRAEFPNRDLSDTSWLGKQARSIALALLGLYQSVQDAARDNIPSDETSSARLDEFAALFGLSNGAGSYGRKGATASAGGAGTVTYSGAGPFPYVLAAGTTLTASDGVTIVELTSSLSFGSAGSLTGAFDAVTTGTAGNLALGSVLTWVSPPAGLTSSVTLTTGMSGGTAQESDGDLLTRILDRLQNPPKGGTAADWRAWAEGVTGVDAAYVYPRRDGTGTVRVVATQAGTGTGRQLASVSAITTAIDDVRPVTVEGYTVSTPYMPSGAALVISARPLLTALAATWDLDESAGPFTVASSTSTTVTLNANWADITTQLSNGKKPRILLKSNAGTPAYIYQLATISSYNSGTFTATISACVAASVGSASASSSSWAVNPSAGDAVYAGSAATQAIADAIIAYVDALGPSKASGYADTTTTQAWDDTARIDQLYRVILDVTDSSGRDYAYDLSALTLNGGSSNVTASDDGVNAPQCLYVSQVVVRQ